MFARSKIREYVLTHVGRYSCNSSSVSSRRPCILAVEYFSNGGSRGVSGMVAGTGHAPVELAAVPNAVHDDVIWLMTDKRTERRSDLVDSSWWRFWRWWWCASADRSS